MNHADGSTVEEIEGDIAVAGYIHAVGRYAFEAEIAGDRFAVEGKPAAGKSARAQRKQTGTPTSVAEPLPVAGEHLKVREQVVRPEHGLCPAHVRVAGNDGVGIGLGQPDQVVHQPG